MSGCSPCCCVNSSLPRFFYKVIHNCFSFMSILFQISRLARRTKVQPDEGQQQNKTQISTSQREADSQASREWWVLCANQSMINDKIKKFDSKSSLAKKCGETVTIRFDSLARLPHCDNFSLSSMTRIVCWTYCNGINLLQFVSYSSMVGHSKQQSESDRFTFCWHHISLWWSWKQYPQ